MRPLAQLDDPGVDRLEPPKAMPTGAQPVGEHEGVPAIVLCARHAEAVAEAVELLGVDGVHGKAALHQGLDDRAVRHLDAGRDLGRLHRGGRGNPYRHRGQPLAVMREGALAEQPPLGIQNANLVHRGLPSRRRHSP
jgi:hypothetical protein